MYLIGGGGFAKELLGWMKPEERQKVEGYFSDVESNSMNCRYMGRFSDVLNLKSADLLIAVGKPESRRVAIDFIKRSQNKAISFIHSTALVSIGVELGTGIFIGPFCLVSEGAKLDDFVFLNCYSSVGHHSTVGAETVLNPYSAITGACEIGMHCVFGLKSAVLPGLKVADQTRVAASTTIFRSIITPGKLWMGAPATMVKGL